MPWTKAEALFFYALTVLGDPGFVLPASAILFIALWASGGRLPALGFAAAAGLCAVLVTSAKIGFMACGAPGGVAVHSPSGHAALSTMFYGSVGLVAYAASPGALGRALLAACLLLIAMIAASRVALDAHNIAETLLGGAIGAACFAVFWRFAPARLVFDRRAAMILFAVFLAGTALFGRRFYVEHRLERAARWLQSELRC